MRMTKIIRVLFLAGLLAGFISAALAAHAIADEASKAVKVLKPADKLITQDDSVPVEKSNGETSVVKLKIGKNSVVVDAADENGEAVKVLKRVLRIPKFKDIDSSYWAKNDIELTCAAGLFEKSRITYFRPDETISREKFAMLISLAVGVKLPVVKIAPARDVKASNTNTKYDYYVIKERGIMDLDADGNFRPQDKITRAEAVMAIARLEHLTENWDMAEPPFADMQPRQNGARWISAVKNAGLLKFAEDRGYLDADGYLTNAEYAAIIAKTAEGKRAIANILNFDIGYSVEKAAK